MDERQFLGGEGHRQDEPDLVVEVDSVDEREGGDIAADLRQTEEVVLLHPSVALGKVSLDPDELRLHQAFDSGILGDIQVRLGDLLVLRVDVVDSRNEGGFVLRPQGVGDLVGEEHIDRSLGDLLPHGHRHLAVDEVEGCSPCLRVPLDRDPLGSEELGKPLLGGGLAVEGEGGGGGGHRG